MNPIKQYSTRTHTDKDERHEPNQTILNVNLIGFMSLIFIFMCSRWVLFDWVHVAHLYLYVFSLSIVWLGSCRSFLVLCVLVEYCLIGFMSLIFIFMCSRWVLFDWVHVAHLYIYVFTLSIVWLGSCRSSLSVCVLVEYCLIGFMSLIFSFMCSRWVLFDWVHVAHLYIYVFTLSIVWLGSCRSSLVLCVLVEYCLIGFMSLIFILMCSRWVLFDWVHVAHLYLYVFSLSIVWLGSCRSFLVLCVLVEYCLIGFM